MIKIILSQDIIKEGGWMWTGFIWLTTVSSGRFLWRW